MPSKTPEVVVVSPSEVGITYAFNPNYERHQRTWQWLEAMIGDGRKDEIPPVVLVRHPKSGRSLIMDGNVRTAYAARCGHELRAEVIHDQTTLTRYLYRQNLMLHSVSRVWFGICDFGGLVKVMEAFAAHPKFSDMPEDERARFMQLAKDHSGYIRELELFGPDDD